MSTSSAASALTYLWLTSARNWWRARRAQMRQPRYVVALLLGALYILWVFSINGEGQDSPFADLMSSGTGSTIAAAIVLLFASRWWLSKPDRTALAFSPAEVHLLFPAPVTRRTLVQSKLARAQVAILLNVLIWTVLLRGGADSLDGWQRGIGLWILFSTFTLHRLAAALVRLNAVQHKAAGLRRAALPTLIFVAMFGTIAVVLWQARPDITAAWSLGLNEAALVIRDALRQPLAAIVLAPVHALVSPVFAQTGAEWLRSIGPALLVLVLHFVWVVRTDAAFEEAALEASQERAKAVAAMRGTTLRTNRSKQGRVARIPPLPMWGHRAITMIWKNTAAAIRGGGWMKQLALIFVAFGAFILLFRVVFELPLEAVFMMTLIWGVMFLLFGPVSTRFDLRLDLRDLAAIRTLPLSGRSIVTADIVGVSLLHSISMFVYMLAPLLVSIATEESRVETATLLGAPGPVVLTVLIVIPAINLLTFTVQNALALLYPAWVQLGTDRRGFEAMGQTMLTFGITAVVVAVALVFPVLLGGAIGFIGRVWLGAWGLPLAALVGLIVVVAELVPLWFALGGILDRTEPGDVPGQRS